MDRLNAWDWICIILVVIGGLNWGLVGIFNFDIVAFLFGHLSALSRIIYIIIAIAAIYLIIVACKYGRKPVKHETTTTTP